ncbi:hypothetical protein FIBSPDRAFT_892428 [Athelia psychrophila]|uniref:Uncharacterized protein n=1 Tax=Athelia psychrophila TaxID=1759441 RepID=A0A166II71_9AGAM|nr:hypothetical protein FIBSPDRAFT_892428 [Fibularhizoctonia sp. CBS 109695]
MWVVTPVKWHFAGTSGNLDFGRQELVGGQVHILSCCSASSIRQGFNTLEDEDGLGWEFLMEQGTPELLCSSLSLDSVFDPEDPCSSDFPSLCPTLLNHPPLVPSQSAGRVTLSGVYHINPGWPRWGYFVDIELGAQPPCLAVPHSLNLPITQLSWTHPMSHWCRSLLKDISCFPIQVVVFEEVEEVSVYNVTVQGLPGDDDFLNSAAGRCVDFNSEDDDLVGYRSDMSWSGSSRSGSSVHYTDSIEDLVGGLDYS